MKKKKEPVVKPCGCSDERPPHICKICYDPGITENKIENDIIEYCDNLQYCEVTKTGTKGRRKGNTYLKAKKSEGVGKGDLTICYYGFYIEMEVKKPGEKRSTGQIKREPKIKKALGQYWLVDNFEDAVTMLAGFKSKIEVFLKPLNIKG